MVKPQGAILVVLFNYWVLSFNKELHSCSIIEAGLLKKRVEFIRSKYFKEASDEDNYLCI
ncbi:hypothetical protein SAMN05216232_0134 [Virgibacillus subterraneus]|uniref:Uncharacterized protein n=1 Tax=Virgibacillus subterraneus TaxID=621109 RepID=A0A1H9L5K1_9BACI|nr:hypothetical protein SAMN05216232_0134 [Virgibacillus subterraneus]